MHPSIVIPYGLMLAVCLVLGYIGGLIAGTVGVVVGFASGVPVGGVLLYALIWLEGHCE